MTQANVGTFMDTERESPVERVHAGHARSTRVCHWVAAACVLTLACTGFMILMVHPRLYWGAVGNDLTPALVELPISRNYRHAGWDPAESFFAATGSPRTAVRTYDIFNQNGWGRSLHFLAAWILVVTGAVYVVAGLVSGHFRRDLVPRADELRPWRVWQDLVDHLRLRVPRARGGPAYGVLQKLAYGGVVFVALPMMLFTGLCMSPAIAAAYPDLAGLFGGSQSARTLHFSFFFLVVVFIVVHVAMVLLSGFKAQMRAMTVGK